MNNALLARGGRRALSQIRYVSPVSPGLADDLVGSVYAQVERDFGFLAPPVALHSPAPTPLAAAWMMLRETLLATGDASRAEKEVVAAAVSAANECPYCVTVHGAVVKGLIRATGHGGDNGRGHAMPPVLGEIAHWARSTIRPAAPRAAGIGNFPELAAVAVTFHYLNRMVSVFLPKSPMPNRLPEAAGGWFMRILGSAMLSSVSAPGAALDLLPEAPLPAEFSWAADEPRVAAALSRAAAAIEEAGAQAIPSPVRELVLNRLRGWDGQPQGPSRAWVDAAVATLASADQSAGRLALLTAQAPFQVSSRDIDEFRLSARGATSGDEAIVGLTSWSSMAAARRIGSWMRSPASPRSPGPPSPGN